MSAPASLGIVALCALALGMPAGTGDAETDAPEPLPAAAPDEVLLGEPLEVEIEPPAPLAEAGADARFALDLLGPLPDHVELVDAPRLVREEQAAIVRASLRAWRRGPLRLEGLALAAGGVEHALAPIETRVVLDLPPERAPRLAEPLDPIALPRPPVDPVPYVAGIAGFLAALGTALVLLTRPRVVPPPPPRPPHLVAIERLEAMRARPPRDDAQVEQLVVGASDVLRAYIEAAFLVRAPELTTEEFLVEAADRHDAVGRHAESLARFLQRCDLVKFAGHRPAPERALALLDEAVAFVEATRGETRGRADPAGAEAAP